MKLKRITIENFRSYYGSTEIEIGEGLTLLLGSNGDGKTTFFDAINWLFDSTSVSPDYKNISKKKLSELMDGQKDTLKVSIAFDHEGEKMFEKGFDFGMNNGSLQTSNFHCYLYEVKGSERIKISNGSDIFDKRIFDKSIRRYCMFKGESELNIFTNKEALDLLVQTFSDIREFDPYVAFTEQASQQAEVAAARAVASDKKLEQASKMLTYNIESEKKKISDLKNDLNNQIKEITNYTQLLQDMENNKEKSGLMKTINERIENFTKQKAQIAGKIKDNYTVRLLDDMWILMGFEDIAREYSDKVADFSKRKRKEEKEYQRQQGSKDTANVIKELSNGSVPLAVYVPDEKTMREMLHDHICKVCNRPAPEGSDAYEFMLKKLNDYIQSLEPSKVEEEEDTLFPLEYITELDKRDTVLANNMPFLSKMRSRIISDIEFNNDRIKELQAKENQILDETEKKKHLLAEADGLSEEDLLNAYQQITDWFGRKGRAEQRRIEIEQDINDHKELLEEYEEKFNKLASKSSASAYNLSSLALKRIGNAFRMARKQNRREFLDKLEKYANEYLEKLNVNDFRGTIRIVEHADETVSTALKDKNDMTVSDPNTALRTTMYMSILFAVAKLTTLQRENDYPLIFDAPTSSFGDTKENEFYKVIGGVNKQVIIVTKSFLTEKNGIDVLDYEKISSVNGKVYRIEKKRPFDPEDQSTVQTTIQFIK